MGQGGAPAARVVVLTGLLLVGGASRAWAQSGPSDAPAAAPSPPAPANPLPEGGQDSGTGDEQADQGTEGPAAPEPTAPPATDEASAPQAGPDAPEHGAELDSEQAPEVGQASAPLQPSDASARTLGYRLERVRIEGHKRTRDHLIRRFVPVSPGASFNVNDPEIQALRYRLLGTGWYDRVDLRLERGKYPGWVVLVIEVEERQTIVFQQLAAGLGWSVPGLKKVRGDADDPGRKPEPYLGLALADLNFLGSGSTLGGQLLVAPDQQGFELSYFDPWLRRSRWSFSTKASFVRGREYFGGDRGVLVSVRCEPEELSKREFEDCESSPPAAVVEYYRAGLGMGTARDVGSFTRLSLDWRGDFVYVPSGEMPAAASETRGVGPLATAPIDFAIEPYSSFVSMVSLGLTYDKRDSSVLPTRGLLVSFSGDLASHLIGSTYEFLRVQTSIQRWTPLPWGHTVRVGGYAGAVYGNAPFFYKFFVSDLTDLMPSRILGLNLDHRPAPNLFGVFQCGKPFEPGCGTAIAQMRQEELAARVDVEYTWPFLRGRRKFVRSGDAFALLGLYTLADPRDLRVAVPGYHGLARLPIDLTFDLGVRLDTRAGVFQIGLAKLLWLPAK